MKAHVAPWKKAEVAEIEQVITGHPVVGVVTFTNIPASSMQRIRAGLRGKAVVRAAKNNLIHLAFADADKKLPGIKQLADAIDGETAIVGTELNPFALYKQFKASRTHAPARPGQVAPLDIEVKKGDTPFKPGPIVGDLQKAGIPAAIESGKVVIKSDKVVVRQGETISAELAQALVKLEIHPIEIGLEVLAVYEDGLVYKPAVLDVDEATFHGELVGAIRNAFSLAMDRAWLTPQTVELLVTRAARQALALGIEAGFLTRETIQPILSKAYLQMLGLAKLAKGEALDDELKEALGTAAQAATAAPASGPAEKPEEKKDEEDQVSEEEAAGGLGALFD